MSANYLPNEILQDIFQRLYGCEVIRCRAVCRRWRDAVDDLPDSHWERICRQQDERNEYTMVHKKYGLSWYHVFKALRSWHNLPSLPVPSPYAVGEKIQHFKVLPHGMLSLLKNERHRTNHGYGDTIVYYNLETSQVSSIEKFEFAFYLHLFDENEHFWVLKKPDGTLCIVLKANKKQYCVGKTSLGSTISLIDNEVYFQSVENNFIYVSRLVHDNGVIITTEPLEAFIRNYDVFYENIIAYSKKNGLLHMISEEGGIYIHENADFSRVCEIDIEWFFYLDEFETFGFNWKSGMLYEWLADTVARNHFNTFLMFSVCYGHGHILLTSEQYSSSVNILLTEGIGGFDASGIMRCKAKRRIALNKMVNYNKAFRGIDHLDIVETKSSHKVMVLVQNKLFALEFPHCVEQIVLRSMTSKKKPEKISTNTKKVVATKRKSVIVNSKQTKKKYKPNTHRYNTRSTLKIA